MAEAGELEKGPFTAGDLRRTVETRLAAVGVSAEVRAQLQSHGLGGIQADTTIGTTIWSRSGLRWKRYTIWLRVGTNVTPIKHRARR